MTGRKVRGSVGVLTPRQAEVLKYEVLGFSQEEISKQLGISQPRVSAALKTAKDKVALARDTVDFHEELKYLASLRDSGYRGQAILKKGYHY
jgi:transcriptional regulator